MDLGDPELELIDPTPNVHALFMHFDDVFFWAQLKSRATVRWSKRMYSCAGVCCYSYNSGAVDIALSEPLLKLRSRKDLVETLLHEMIHAYLFITNRDSDRDGHGRNFKCHMYRINKSAGLNITVYHDFHDEVKLYQTHWWRCNGDCSKVRPNYGVVRRTMNRPPGPSDYWWNYHQRWCGGKFIKIKEPENARKKKDVSKPNADITKYINNNNSKVMNKNVPQTVLTPKPINTLNNVKNIANNNAIKSVIISPTDSHKKSPPLFSGKGQTITHGSHKRSDSDVSETLRNVWGNKQLSITVVGTDICKKSMKPPKSTPELDKVVSVSSVSSQSSLKNNFKDVHGSPLKFSDFKTSPVLLSGQVRTNNDQNINNDVSVTVRNVWTNKILPSATLKTLNVKKGTNPNKHKFNTLGSDDTSPMKIKKIDDYFKNTASSLLSDIYEQDMTIIESKFSKKLVAVPSVDLVQCPICNIKIRSEEANTHLDECLNKDVIDELLDEDTTVRNNQFISSQMDTSKVNNLVGDEVPEVSQFKSGIDDLQNESEDKMLVDLVSQLDERVANAKSETNETNSNLRKYKETSMSIKSEPGTSRDTTNDQKCPCCGSMVSIQLDVHLEKCLAFDYDATTPAQGSSNEVIVIDNDDELDETLTLNATGTKTPCPCCLKMVEMSEMNDHLDVCLS